MRFPVQTIYNYETKHAVATAQHYTSHEKATVVLYNEGVGGQQHTFALTGNYERLRELRDMLNELLEDWS